MTLLVSKSLTLDTETQTIIYILLIDIQRTVHLRYCALYSYMKW